MQLGKLVADIIVETLQSAGVALAPHLRSCIAVVGEPKLLNLQER